MALRICRNIVSTSKHLYIISLRLNKAQKVGTNKISTIINNKKTDLSFIISAVKYDCYYILHITKQNENNIIINVTLNKFFSLY